MGKADFNTHFVATLDEAAGLIRERKEFWACNCGCREGRGKCKRSRMDVCLYFNAGREFSGSGGHKISRSEAEGILREAVDKNLVARPFRNMKEHDLLDGICFCCDDCCGYILDPEEEECDKGKMIEHTEMADCTSCGICVEVCHFKARIVEDDQLQVIADKCYGCGLCVDTCPTGCIEMKSRSGT